MNKLFHYIVRGIIRDGNDVLLAHQIGDGNTFLPGGHIEIGEKAEDALCREISEEIDMEVSIGRFIGAIENTWVEDDIENYEINLIFEVIVEEMYLSQTPVSCEKHLEFLWVPVDNLQYHNLMPTPMIDCIRKMDNKDAYWNSTL